MRKTKRKYKIHCFDENKTYATICNIRPPSEENWQRKDYCITNLKKVTCKNCLKRLETLKNKKIK